MPTPAAHHPPVGAVSSTSQSHSQFSNPQLYHQKRGANSRDRAVGHLPRSSSLAPPTTLLTVTAPNLSKPLPSPHGASPDSVSPHPERIETAARDEPPHHHHQHEHPERQQLQLDHLHPFNLPVNSRGSSHYVNRWSASTNSSHGNQALPAPDSRSPPSHDRAARRASSVDITFLLAGSPPPSANLASRNPRRSRTPSEPREYLASLGTGDSRPSNRYRDHHSPPTEVPSSREQRAGDPVRYPARDRFHSAEGQSGHHQGTQQSGDLADSSSRLANAMQYEPSQDRHHGHGHVRNRSGRSSDGSTRFRGDRPPSQKAMLSRALQQANAAVQLDNAQDFTSARLAYTEACTLLEHVLQRTTAQDDQRKLEAIVSLLFASFTEFPKTLY